MKRTFAKRILLRGVAAAALAWCGEAGAVNFSFSNPTVTGSGVGKTALFSNIGTQDGISIDMRATVVAQSRSTTNHGFAVSGNDYRFELAAGEFGSTKYATVHYEFFESGTSNPIPVAALALTIDDLDKTSDRTEELQVSQISRYILNSNSTVSVTLLGGATSLKGGGNYNNGDPQGAVTLEFLNKTTITISYASLNNATGSVAHFFHDGNGEFAFPSPEESTVGYEVHFTYHIQNDEDVPVKMDFTNRLPAGMTYDQGFEPVTNIVVGDGSAAAFRDTLEFDPDNGGVSFGEVEMAPGVSRFALKTVPILMSGVHENSATVTPSANSGFPQVEMVSVYSVDLGGGPGGRPAPETVPQMLSVPAISLAAGALDTTVTLSDPNPAGSATLMFAILPLPSATGCDILSGGAPPAGTFTAYAGPVAVTNATYPGGFAVIGYAASADPQFTRSGDAIAYKGASVSGVAGGGVDVATTNGGQSDDDYAEMWEDWPGDGDWDEYRSDYDDAANRATLDLFNFGQGLDDIDDNVRTGVRFKIIVVNASLSPKVRIGVNEDVHKGSPYVNSYDNTSFELLPVFSLDGMAGTTRLTKLQIGLDDDVITGAGLLPTSSSAVRNNIPGRGGEWRNGALTIQIVKVNADGSAIKPLDYTKSAGGHGVAPANTMDHEVVLFWNWGGSDYDKSGNTYAPESPATVWSRVSRSEVPLCNGL